jgi:transposase-like protein
LFVAIDRTSKVAFARLFERANTAAARTFLDQLVEAIPYKIKVVLTDNGIQYADLPKNRSEATTQPIGPIREGTMSRVMVYQRSSNAPSTNWREFLCSAGGFYLASS